MDTGPRQAGSGLALAPPVALTLLAALALLAAALRLDGLDRLLPHLQEADANLVEQLRVHRRGADGPGTEAAELAISYYAYPTLLARGLALLPEDELPQDTPPGALLERGLRSASADFVRTRTAVACLALLLVPLTWLLARRFLGPYPALLAAALVAVSPLHLLFSQEARPHGAQATFALAAVIAALRLRARPTLASYLAAGAAAGLACATLHNGAATLAPLAAAHVWRERAQGPQGNSRSLAWLGPLLLVAPAALAFATLYPSAPKLQPGGPASASDGAARVLEFGGHTLPLDRLDGSGFAIVWRYLWDYEPGLVVAALAGLALWLAQCLATGLGRRGSRRDLLVALAYCLSYLAAVGLMGLTQDRFLLPLLPFLACAAAYPAAWLTSAGGRGRRAAALVWSLAALAFPALVAAKFVRLRAAPDTFEQAAAWVREHVRPVDPAGADGNGERVLASARLTLPLFHSAEALEHAGGDYATRRTVWIGWQRKHAGELAALGAEPRWNLFLTPGKLLNSKRETGPDEVEAWLAESEAAYAVIEHSRLMAGLAAGARLREAVAARGELIAIFAGEDERWATEPPLDFQEIPDFTERLLAATAFGPRVEVYRLSR